jgi:hypothetical protein
MTTLTLRTTKGSPLTNAELDANFTNLNLAKIELGGDLQGTTSSPVVTGLQGRSVSASLPTVGNVIAWNGVSQWSYTSVLTQLSVTSFTATTVTLTTATATHVSANTIVGMGSGFSNITSFTTVLNAVQFWVIPPNVQRWKVTLIGGGAAGGGTAATAGQFGSGGGSGALSIHIFNKLDTSSQMSYFIGGGGPAAAAGVAGNAGTSTVASYGLLAVTAGGGGAGQTAATRTPGTGGTATGGTVNIPGGPGGHGGVMAATSPVSAEGGTPPWGFGAGAERANATGNGQAGTGFGAGGSGGCNFATATSRAGGAGTGGILIVEW